jgi:FlaA1/EpsC-like NDP-sugar epimerase
MKLVFPKQITPRWLIFTIDLALCAFAFIAAYLIRFEFAIPKNELDLLLLFAPFYFVVRAVLFYVGKSYSGIIRFTSTQDAIRLGFVLLQGSLAFILINFIRKGINGAYLVPISIVILEFLVSAALLVFFRLSIKFLYMELKNPRGSKTKVVVFGAGEGGLLLKRTLDRDRNSALEVLAFFDDNQQKVGKKLEGVDILSSKKLDEFLASNPIEELIISIPEIANVRKRQLVDLALKYKVTLKHLPHANNWINGELSAKQLREVKFEDLLGRDVIQMSSNEVKDIIENKVVLVTGAAGSIGSELVRQCLLLNPAKVIACDVAETPMFLLGNELSKYIDDGKLEMVIGDVRNELRMRRMFEAFQPKIVFHAAAYKHVPLMEDNPAEAVATNVFGSMKVLEIAAEFGAERFVMVSTDKAVNPTNVMGASKRIAEMIVQSKDTSLICVTTRFGNVLGSNGSVIPVFRKQIEEGGPVTVTHRDITRFFMTIPEAVQLVLEAGAMGKGNDIFAFDMGQQVRISDLAEQMIRLSGLEPGQDIEIHYTGLRPGEKLYEEVLATEENTVPTHHEKILSAKVREVESSELSEKLSRLEEQMNLQNNKEMVRVMKEIVPEFKSNNSEFSLLDN